MNLPETERQSEHQAAQFALKMKRKYPFDYAGGDRYHEIRGMMLRHHNGVLDSLKQPLAAARRPASLNWMRG